MKIHDFTDLAISDRNGSYGGNSGDKEGVFYEGEYWIIKYPKNAREFTRRGSLSYTTSPQSEYIGSHIYEILGFPVHKTLLGIRNHKLVVACKDLCDETHRLIEFRQLKNTHNEELSRILSGSFTSTGGQHFVSLGEIMTHLDYNPELKGVQGLKNHFWESVLIDGLINNNDRNNGNWGLLVSKSDKMISPVYDNGSSFSPNIPESRIRKKLMDESILTSSIHNDITAYSLDGERNARFEEILYLDMREYPDLRNALLRVVPIIRAHMPQIMAMLEEIPENANGIDVLSIDRKQLYKKELRIRLDVLLEPAYMAALQTATDS